jgi:hypothetical protein
MVEELEEVPQQPVLALVPLGGLDNLGQGLVVGVRAQDAVGLDRPRRT